MPPSFQRAEKEGQLAGANSAEERLQADKALMAAQLDAAKAASDSLESAVSMLRRANAGLDAELQQLKVRLEVSRCRQFLAADSGWAPFQLALQDVEDSALRVWLGPLGFFSPVLRQLSRCVVTAAFCGFDAGSVGAKGAGCLSAGISAADLEGGTDCSSARC